MAKSKRRSKHSTPDVRTPLSEQILLDVVTELEGAAFLCTSLGRGQFAKGVAEVHPHAQVTCHVFDVYQSALIRRLIPSAVNVACTADLPGTELDVVAFPLKSRGEAELTRDLLQSGYLALREGGQMLVALDTLNDHWMHTELRKLFPKVTREKKGKGMLYRATRQGPLAKVKSFECELAFRDGERLIWAYSRPGVFSHRRIDGGARALVHGLEIESGQRVLDMGCGCGAVGFAAAFRAEGVEVLAVDSNARAIQCTEQGAKRNELTRISTELNAEGDCGTPGTFDHVLGNPPYFSNYRIADIFLQAGLRCLKPGGKIQIVTKTPHWFAERMPELFDDVEVEKGTHYTLVTGRQR